LSSSSGDPYIAPYKPHSFWVTKVRHQDTKEFCYTFNVIWTYEKRQANTWTETKACNGNTTKTK
jgi:hypothetical protein